MCVESEKFTASHTLYKSQLVHYEEQRNYNSMSSLLCDSFFKVLVDFFYKLDSVLFNFLSLNCTLLNMI